MKKKLMLFVGTVVVALATMFALGSTKSTVGAQGASCQAQCRVAYDTCVRHAKNPGGLNQCKKAYEACLGNCK